MPMSDAEITHVQTTAGTPAARLAVTLAAVHAARGEAIRALRLEDVDFPEDRITIDGNVQPMSALTRAALRSWLAERRTRWPHTLNRHVLISRQTANGTSPVNAYFLERQLTLRGVSLDRVRADRVLGEVLATGADPLHLTTIFDLSETTAVEYATLARRLLLLSVDSGPAREQVSSGSALPQDPTQPGGKRVGILDEAGVAAGKNRGLDVECRGEGSRGAVADLPGRVVADADHDARGR